MTQTLPRTARSNVQTWLDRFAAALTAGQPQAVSELFVEDSFWRDLIAFTWNIKTVEGREQIRDLVATTAARVQPDNWQISEDPSEADGVTEAWLRFDTAVGRGTGHLRLRNTSEGPRAWTLLTTLYELKGHEEPLRFRRPKGAEHGANKGRSTWLERREHEFETLGRAEQPYVLIVGGGQAGIALGARLRQLDVPTIIIDQHRRPGDQWRSRYKSLCLHDPVWYDHLPYIPFPDNWPVFSPKDKIGDWLESYTTVMELNYWGATRCLSASYDDSCGEWTVEVDKDGERLTLRPKQLVLATGMSGKKNLPTFQGMDVFQGEQHHSSDPIPHLGS